MIRRAEPKDLKVILRMAKAFYSHVAFEELGLTLDPEYFMDASLFMMSNPDSSCLLVGEKDGTVVGSIAGQIDPWGFNPNQTVLSEKWWWVDAPERGSFLPFQLVNRLREWGENKGVRAMFLACMANTGNAEQLDRIYRKRMGFHILEHHYAKGLKCPDQ
jgi:hypothetical protein